MVELAFARLRDGESGYSPYGNNLRGGRVVYVAGDCRIEVTYRAGAPAPWMRQPDGSMVHHPPIDETVIAWRHLCDDRHEERP